MFGLGAPELLVILVIVLVLFGGKRLPELGRALGKSIREFKGATGNENDGISSWIKADKESPSSAVGNAENGKSPFREEIESIPGVKEAQDIKDTAGKIKAAGKFFLKK